MVFKSRAETYSTNICYSFVKKYSFDYSLNICWGEPERAPQNGSVHAIDHPTIPEKLRCESGNPPTGSVVMRLTVRPLPKIYVANPETPPLVV